MYWYCVKRYVARERRWHRGKTYVRCKVNETYKITCIRMKYVQIAASRERARTHACIHNMAVENHREIIHKHSINGIRVMKLHMMGILFVMIATLLKCGVTEETSSVPTVSTTLGNLYRQARSEHYYASRYGTEGSSPVTSGTIGIRGDPEHRDAAYYQSRCITCDPKSATADRGWRQRTKYDYYEDDQEALIRHRDRYDDYNDRSRAGGYMYDRPRGPTLDYDRARTPPAYDYDRVRAPAYDYDRYDPYSRNDLSKPLDYPDRFDMYPLRDRYNDLKYDRNPDRFIERGNGYDNLDQRHLGYGNRYDIPSRRPIDDPYYSRYDRYNRNYPPRYDPYDRYDQYERNYHRRPQDDRYDRYPSRGNGEDSRGYYSSVAWSPGLDRGYATGWNYAGGSRDNWRDPGRDRDPGDNWKDLNRDRDTGSYRPRDYFYDSTIPPGGSRGTSYLYDRAESSTKPDSTERDKPTSPPQTQDNNKVYKD